MPSEVSTAAGDQDLGRMVEELKRVLGEARRREAATAEIPSVISRSRIDVQPIRGDEQDAKSDTGGSSMPSRLAFRWTTA